MKRRVGLGFNKQLTGYSKLETVEEKTEKSVHEDSRVKSGLSSMVFNKLPEQQPAAEIKMISVEKRSSRHSR